MKSLLVVILLLQLIFGMGDSLHNKAIIETRTEDTVSIISANVYYGEAESDLVQLIQENAYDVIMIQESTPALHSRLIQLLPEYLHKYDYTFTSFSSKDEVGISSLCRKNICSEIMTIELNQTKMEELLRPKTFRKA